MAKLSDLLIRNEELLELFQQTNRRVKSGWWKRLYEGFTFEGDLINYLLAPKTTTALAERDREYKDAGLPTSSEIVNKYLDLHPSRRETTIKFDGLIVGNRYTTRDICSLARNQNENLGMYAATGSNGMPIAVLKAAIGGNLYRNGRYHDEWVDPERTKFRYYLQEEPETINYEFSKEGNKAIFDGLITDIPVPIYLFVKKKYESKYEYVGIFEANSLSSDRKWFSLVESEHRQDFHNFYDYQKFVAEYLNSNFIEIAENTPILFEKKIPSQSKLPASRQPLEYFENRNPDYMQLREKLKILGNFGEEKALQYEKNRVKSFAPEYAGHVIKVDNDREGFDIRSYRLDGKQIKELKIEVKTTTNSCGTNPFFMSSNEMNVMKMNGRDYWLYRLFNIHSTQPSFYAFRGNVEQMIKFEPSEYLCSI